MEHKGNHSTSYLEREFPDPWPDAYFRQPPAGESHADDLDMIPTESAVAGLFDRYAPGGGHQYRPGTGWMIWDNWQWRPDTEHRLTYEVRRFATELAFGSDKWVKHVGPARFARGVVSVLGSEPDNITPSEMWDADPDIIGIPGSMVYNLRTGDLRPAERWDYLTKQVADAPDSPPLGEPNPPRFLRFLKQAIPDRATRRWLQKWFGYALTARQTEHALAVLVGPGGSGKTTLAELMRDAAGDYGAHMDANALIASRYPQHSTSLAMLQGARMVTADEVTGTWDTGRVKALTGGGTLTARLMRRDNISFRPVAKLTVTTNDMPNLPGGDSGMRRRMHIVRMDRVPTNPDRHLPAKLRQEMPDILAWMLYGAWQWYEDGLGTVDPIQADTDQYFRSVNLAEHFLEDTYERVPGKWVKTSELWTAWRHWTDSTDTDPERIAVSP